MKCVLWIVMTAVYLAVLSVFDSTLSESILLGVLYIVATCALTEIM